MYRIEWLPSARMDMIEISRYISINLQNEEAAEMLAEKIISSVDQLAEFPYRNEAYHPIRPLKKEYRKLLVKNYFVYYNVDEIKKLITVYRIVYKKRNQQKQI